MNRRRFLVAAAGIAAAPKILEAIAKLDPAPNMWAGDIAIASPYGMGGIRPGDQIVINGVHVYTVTHASGDGHSGCITLDRPIHATGRMNQLVHKRGEQLRRIA